MMYLKVYKDNGSINSYEIKKELFVDKSLDKKVSFISSALKEKNALNIFQSYFSDAKSVLFDETNKLLVQKIEDLGITKFKNKKHNKTIFDDKDFSLIYFTSGTTGAPTAALKTKDNIEKEIAVLSKLLKEYNIKKVIVTVPFIHIYGSLTGLFYPFFNDIDIELKEHFLPNDLLQMCEDNSLIVTTPLYIKALNQLASTKNLSKCLFVSSTAPLDPAEAKKFNEKFGADILQLFGSTETGGIAYKFNDQVLWTPLEGVKIDTNKNQELIISSPFVSSILFCNTFKDTNQTLQTFDFIEKVDTRFKLLGRSSQIFKIAGKRYSTIQIEKILESNEDINKALVYVKKNSNSLRGESLDITLESEKKFSVSEIKKMIQTNLSNLKFSIELHYVDKIALSSTGKKLRLQ